MKALVKRHQASSDHSSVFAKMDDLKQFELLSLVESVRKLAVNHLNIDDKVKCSKWPNGKKV